MAQCTMILQMQATRTRSPLRDLSLQDQQQIAQSLFQMFLLHNLQHLNYHIIVSTTNQAMTQYMDLNSFSNNLNLTFMQSSLVPPSSPPIIQQLPAQPKPPRLRKKKIYNPLIAKGKWTQKEQQAYITFLQNNSQFMETSLQRKSKKVFLTMSQIIQTRDADQCRSHHQKMILYRSTVAQIIKYYRNKMFETEEGQSGKLKEIQKTPGRTQETNKCKEEVDEAFRWVANGNCIKIYVETSKIQTYDF